MHSCLALVSVTYLGLSAVLTSDPSSLCRVMAVPRDARFVARDRVVSLTFNSHPKKDPDRGANLTFDSHEQCSLSRLRRPNERGRTME